MMLLQESITVTADVHNPASLSDGTDENTHIQSDAEPVTKVLFSKRWYRPQCRILGSQTAEFLYYNFNNNIGNCNKIINSLTIIFENIIKKLIV